MVGVRGHSLSRCRRCLHGVRGAGGTKAAAAAACARCLGSLSNFRARRPSARPSVLTVGLFNPTPRAQLLVTSTATRFFFFFSVSASYSARDLLELLPVDARPRLSCSLSPHTHALSLSMHSLRLSLSPPPSSLRQDVPYGDAAWPRWESGRRRGVCVCVLRGRCVSGRGGRGGSQARARMPPAARLGTRVPRAAL